MLNATDRCSQAAVRIVGDCQLCQAVFCSRHRLAEGALISFTPSFPLVSPHADSHIPPLPTDHHCPKLSDCREQAFQKNKTKLEAEATPAEKLARV